ARAKARRRSVARAPRDGDRPRRVATEAGRCRARGHRGLLRRAFTRDDRALPRTRARIRSRANRRQRFPRPRGARCGPRRRVRPRGDDRAFGITAEPRLGIAFARARRGGLVWRLGNAAPDVDALFALEGSTPAATRPEPSPEVRRRGSSAITTRNAWLIGGVALVLAIAFVADGLYEGYAPGGKSWTTSLDGSGWIVYLFAAVVLTVAARAVHGAKLALRALIGIALILFIERSFT